MNVSKEDIEYLVKNKLVTFRPSTTYPELSVLKYSRKVFYDQKWNEHPLLVNARGMVIDQDMNIVCFPFTKVFNRGENSEADIPGDSDVMLVRKVNGFLGAVTYNEKYGWIYSTTGSLDSDFVQYIKDKVNPIKNRLRPVNGATYLFEIVHESDPHIIVEEPGAYLIGLREPDGSMVDEFTLDIISSTMIGIKRPESQVVRMREVNSILKTCQHEGFMVIEMKDEEQTGKIIKMKSPFYLVRKMIARKQDLNAALVNAEKVKQNLEEELYCIVDAVRDNKEMVQAMDEQARLQFMTDALMKGFA